MKRSVPSRSALEQAAADLAGKLAGARETLRRALIEAGDTAAARKTVLNLEREAQRVSDELAELDAAATQEAEQQVFDRAEALAGAAAERLETLLAALKPPPMPEAR